MKLKTTQDIHDIELPPDCPDGLMEEMLNKKIPADGTICRKCKWDELCNEKWVAVDDLRKELKEALKREFLNGNLKHTFNKKLVSDEKYIDVFMENFKEELK